MVKIKGKMYTVHNFALPYKDNHLQTHLNIYFSLYPWPISLQLEAGSEPHPKDGDGSITPAERPWQENTTLLGT